MTTPENIMIQDASRRPRHRNRRGRGRGGHGTAVNVPRSSEISPTLQPPTNRQVLDSSTQEDPNLTRENQGRRGPRRVSILETTPLQGSDFNITQDSRRRGTDSTNTLFSSSVQRGIQSGRGLTRNNNRRGTRIVTYGRREFGSHLTSNITSNDSVSSLAGDAVNFVPGQSITQRSRLRNQATTRKSKERSQAPDIAGRTHEDIQNGQYECVICTNEVSSESKIWACELCWSVLHLSCVKRWSQNEASTYHQQEISNSERYPLRQWRCPGCNLPKTTVPKYYTCWCSKEIEPHRIAGLPPHSCGQTCAKPRATNCPHPCGSVCHAGPCLPCEQMGPSLSCFCGREEKATRCTETNYEDGWSCEQICGDLLACGKHRCQRRCHKGLCGSCELPIESSCYCGRLTKMLPCCEKEVIRESALGEITWQGSFDCGTVCGRVFDCGNPRHFCEKKCHIQDSRPGKCPFSPDIISHCPCGKTPLLEILGGLRVDCSAPIACCQEICQKSLACGHLCKRKCHIGTCMPCQEATTITCRCGRITMPTLCHQDLVESPQCFKICRSNLNCGRHECGDHCCPGERKAIMRQASKRKHRPLHNDITNISNFESEHICIKACNRPLKCGNHNCTSLCHKGPCPSCLDAIFDEISCACGRTVLQPPQPCGTKSPECRFDCLCRPTCGHPPVKHQCHQDTEACPKCPFLMEKLCLCGKKTLKNQPCWFSETRCGQICGKKLKCGIHTCKKTCHRYGQCEDINIPCSQPCDRKRSVCGHACAAPCHAPYPCKENTPCQTKMEITCACRNLTQLFRCLATKSLPGNSLKKLTCNDDCLKTQRNAKLADALDIELATHNDSHIPYSTKTLDFLVKDQGFTQQCELQMRNFACNKGEKQMRFKPMASSRRAFLHSLAQDFGLHSESQDAEPHRHVTIFKTARFVSAPIKTLSQCIPLKVSGKLIAKTSATTLTPPLSKTEPWNAYLLLSPKFDLTIDELQTALKPTCVKFDFEIEAVFLPSGNTLIRAISSVASGHDLARKLESHKSSLASVVRRLGFATSVVLCYVDECLNVLHQGDESSTDQDGWSKVVRNAPPSQREQKVDVLKQSKATVMGRYQIKQAIMSKLVEEAPDDWETAAGEGGGS
ncbi:unnamed protein product [Blumeria hordei]|uniref:R3H domain-containing protein n=1 Tax=Blumeria hordei TaxID=2867405 RepID=A0A383UJB5_BLUHO|nr:unnamed protein product [Blumeria hordei]